MATVNNALVTWTDLSTMNLPAKGVPETGNRIATKQFIIDNYVVNETASPFSTYTPLRCPPYQTILAGVVCGMTGTAIYNNLPTPANLSGVPSNAVGISRTTGQYQIIGSANLSNNTKGKLYTSSDYGATWYNNTPVLGYWQTVSISGDGRYMLAVEYYGNAYRSSDYGITWTQISNFPSPAGTTALQTLNFRGAALSGNGQYQAITTKELKYSDNSFYALVFVSSDYGATWVIRGNFQNDNLSVSCVDISSSGQYMYFGTGNIFFPFGEIWRSANYGVNWSPVASDSGSFGSVSILPDNSKAIASLYNSSNYTFLKKSLDNGVTWQNITAGSSGASASDAWYKAIIVAFGGTGYDGYAVVNYNNYLKNAALLTTILNVNQTTTTYSWKSIAASADGQYFLLASSLGTARSPNKTIDWYILT